LLIKVLSVQLSGQ